MWTGDKSRYMLGHEFTNAEDLTGDTAPRVVLQWRAYHGSLMLLILLILQRFMQLMQVALVLGLRSEVVHTSRLGLLAPQKFYARSTLILISRGKVRYVGVQLACRPRDGHICAEVGVASGKPTVASTVLGSFSSL